jgi:hypothetical protein
MNNYRNAAKGEEVMLRQIEEQKSKEKKIRKI